MEILKLFFYLCIIPIIYASHDCQISWCGDDNIVIRFPFQLESEQQDPHCGYSGFELLCSNDSKAILKLPHTEKFYVRNINYIRQQIQLYDPDHCLPKLLLSLNLSGSPFIAIFRNNYTFLSCSYPNTDSQLVPIECLSNSTNFVSSIPSVNLTNSLLESCHVIRNISVPAAWQGLLYEGNFRDDLSEDLRLTWYAPDCTECESQGMLCGFENGENDQVGCFYDYQRGLSSHNKSKAMRILSLSIVGTSLICAIGVTCFVYFKIRIAARQRSAAAAISLQPATATMGLDESTIESYQKLVLGESRRLPGPNGGCCSICLSDYKSKEIVRCIPKCRHCFHAECIDKWLRMNSSCPICRNFPSTNT
ncbi:hypothetical protein TanjilG_10870 [Lupinus angustifolius]|uniref:RING-type domain-containing protein n=1 Tax=Lupinus angustifolius TaxID=3871 RepID=A0A1J7H3S0_LUPAN|nr:PREDICTED: putative RING-H2 finger protein ATL21A [Lupinus angustifolius]OIV95050.1 hypothetical protein TanjilG_10870 [Lupinus angustifolius]